MVDGGAKIPGLKKEANLVNRPHPAETNHGPHVRRRGSSQGTVFHHVFAQELIQNQFFVRIGQKHVIPSATLRVKNSTSLMRRSSGDTSR